MKKEDRIKKAQLDNITKVDFGIEGQATAFSCAVIQAAINLGIYDEEYIFEQVGRIIFKMTEDQFHTIETTAETNFKPERIPSYLWLDFVKEVSRIRSELFKPNYEIERTERTHTDPEVMDHFQNYKGRRPEWNN